MVLSVVVQPPEKSWPSPLLGVSCGSFHLPTGRSLHSCKGHILAKPATRQRGELWPLVGHQGGRTRSPEKLVSLCSTSRPAKRTRKSPVLTSCLHFSQVHFIYVISRFKTWLYLGNTDKVGTIQNCEGCLYERCQFLIFQHFRWIQPVTDDTAFSALESFSVCAYRQNKPTARTECAQTLPFSDLRTRNNSSVLNAVLSVVTDCISCRIWNVWFSLFFGSNRIFPAELWPPKSARIL